MNFDSTSDQMAFRGTAGFLVENAIARHAATRWDDKHIFPIDTACEYPLEGYVRELRVHQIPEGTNETMHLIITKRALEVRVAESNSIMLDLVQYPAT